MLLKTIRISRPDLAEEVRELVHMICGHSEGGQLPVTELVRILGISVAPEFHEQLNARGALVLAARDFVNEGPVVQRKVKLLGFDLNLEIAPMLQGTLTRGDQEFTLGFQTDRSVSASKLLFRAELRTLTIDTRRIHVDFSGAQNVIIDLS